MIIMINGNAVPFLKLELESVEGNLVKGVITLKVRYSKPLFELAETNKLTCMQYEGVHLDNCQLGLPEYVNEKMQEMKVKFIEVAK